MEEPVMAEHRVVILCNQAKVVPAVVIVGEGDRISFESIGGDAEVLFHGPQSPLDVDRVNLAGDAEYAVGPCGVNKEAKPGVHPYSVWCFGPEVRYAQGDSDPILIIKRPNRT
jgi:hypothetical protein